MHLTKRVIDSTSHPEHGQIFLRDDSLRGFGLRVTAGSKVFILERKINGQSRRIVLGHYGDLTIDQARALALERIVEIQRGQDPVAERKQRRLQPTFGDLEQLYLERHAIHKKSAVNDVWILKNYVADWRPRKLRTITRADVAARHADMGKTRPVSANRMVALVRTMFNKAHDWGLHPGPNPASGIRFFKEVKRDRFVTPAELPRLWTALQKEPNPYVRGAFFIGLLTGARRSEVLTMRWEDLDLIQGLWRIPDTKSGQPHTIPLPAPVIQELQRLPRLKDNPHVFCGRWGRSHLVNVSKPWTRIRKEAGLDDVRIHDLRRTLGSWMVAAGASLALIGKTLNHQDVATTSIYARLQLEPVRAALEANATRMLTVIEAAEEKEGRQA